MRAWLLQEQGQHAQEHRCYHASQQSGAYETTTTAPDTATSTTSLTTTTAEKAADSEKVKLSASGVKEGSLILVNSEHALQLSQEELNLKNVYEASRSGDTVTYRVGYTDFLMDADALEHLGEMMDDFYTATGYSSLEVFGGDYAETQTGLSFNLKINFGDGTSDYYNAEKYPDYSWISEHAAEYGFVVRYPEDKDEYTGQSGRSYVFRYVGEPHAAYMQEQTCVWRSIWTRYSPARKKIRWKSPWAIRTTRSFMCRWVVPMM